MTDQKPEMRAFAGRGLLILILVVLLLVNIPNFVDGPLPFIRIDAIRRDLHLSAAQISLLAGLSFAVVYAFAGLPPARLADRYAARWVVALSLAFWSLMTGAGGLSQNFCHLIGARRGVAAREAGSTPATHALITRLYPANRRAEVVAIFSLG